MKTPKRFSVMGCDISVVYIKDLMATKDAYGHWHPSRNLIELQMPDAQHSEDVIAQAFWHEAFHCILDCLGRERLNKDEAFVEQVGQCLHQLDKTRS